MMPVRFAKLVEYFSAFEKASGDAQRRLLADLFRRIPKRDMRMIVYLCLGSIASETDGADMGMANKMVLRALAKVTGKSVLALAHAYKRVGDMGDLAERSVGRARGRLSVRQVFESLRKVAAASGARSQQVKIDHLVSLLRAASPCEAKYICRLVLGNLRFGIGRKMALDALSIAFAGSKKALKEELERAYSINPDVGMIAETIATKGKRGIAGMGIVIGRPVRMMLCQRVKSLDELKRRMGYPLAVEEKYDGERIQAHVRAGRVTLYSRRLENITAQFPDIVKAIRQQVMARSAILEGEAMPVDANGRFLPFQRLMSRKRKHGVAKYARKIPVVWCVFDILQLNGRSLLAMQYPLRWAALVKIIRKGGLVRLANHRLCDDVACVERMFRQIVKRGGEGIVVKSLRKTAVYRAGVRGWHWIKWKPEYLKGQRDTYDLVVVGAYAGRGRRAGRYGALLCAAYDKGRFETFTKVGTGFSDRDLAALPQRLNRHRVKAKPRDVVATKAMEPDVWFKPVIVCEVSGSSITRSSNHTAGMVKGKGLALRFPRFLRWRDDKAASQATTVKEIRRMA